MADSAEFEFDAQSPGGLKARLSLKNCRPDRDIPEIMLTVTISQNRDDAQPDHARLGYTDDKRKMRPAWYLPIHVYGDEEALAFVALLKAVVATIEREQANWVKQPKEAVLVNEER
jgi:hypothetical protein